MSASTASRFPVPGTWRTIGAVFPFVALLLAACAGSPPSRPLDLGAVFAEQPDWYEDARRSSQRWNVPVSIMMAIMWRESGFDATARPERTRCLWIFPGPFPSSAYGYAQAIDAAWSDYRRHTGRLVASRDRFSDAIDFIGWYCHTSSVRCGISKTDAVHLYLAYHEGHAGYLRGAWRTNPRLVRAAEEVRDMAARYDLQYRDLPAPSRGGCLGWPF